MIIFDIQYFASDVKLTAENDEYSNSDSNQIIYALGGNDKIFNVSDDVTINGDANNDLIINGQFFARGGTNVELNGGTDNDTITNSGSYSKIDGGAGDDLIHNGYYYYEPWNAYYDNSGSDGAYENELKSSYTTIYGGSGNDSIYNRADNVTIDAETGDNYIYSEGTNVVVNVDGGKNTVEGNSIKINGGQNNDSISGDGENITINGGAGNDTLTGGSYTDVFQYDNGGGNDVITNYSGEDVIHIASGKIDSYSFNGGDLIFYIGDGSLTLKNMTNHAITVKDSSGKTSTKIYGNGYSPQQVIKNFVHSMANTALDTRLKLDEAIQLCSGFKSLQEVIDKMVADCLKVNDADKFLRDYCGIILDNEDTGAITGWDAGGLKIKTHEGLMPEHSAAKYPTEITFTKRGLTLTVPEKDTLSDQEQLVIKGLYSWWMDNSLDLIEKSYGLSFSDKPYSIPFYFENKPGNFGWAWGGPSVSVNMAYTKFDEADKTGGGLDGALVHEFTHVMQCNFNVWSYMPNYMTEGMANLTGGSDGFTTLAGNSDSLAAYLDVDNTFSEDGNVYTVGYLFWRYLMKQASDSYDSLGSYAFKNNSEIVGTKKADFITSNANKVSVSSGKGRDTITAYGKNSTISGDSGNDYILVGSTAKKITVFGGKGNDTISNKGSASKIYGNDGNDSISNRGASAKIYGGNDSILVGKKSEYKWNDDGTGEWIYTSYKNATISGDKGDDTISNYNANASISGGSGNDKIYSYADKSKIYGGDGNDSISNYGSNVTVTGGKGNDSIRVYGDDMVIYAEGDGNDVITNYSSADTINITGGKISSSSLDGSDVVLKVGSGSLRFKNIRYASDKKITILDSSGKITSKTYDNNNLIVNGTAKNDSLRVDSGSNVTINAGNGNDTIYNKASNSSIIGGAGEDSICNEGDKVKIYGNDGNDSISNRGARNDSILVGKKSEYKWNDDGTGEWIYTSYKNATISGDKGNDTISNYNANASISGGSGNDKIYSYADKSKIYGNIGNDFIINGQYWESEKGGHNVKIYGGAGNDTITSHGKDSVLKGGSGDDVIYNGFRYYEPWTAFYDYDDENYKGDNTTINGGIGNDTISLSSYAVNNVINYASGDGKDTIEGFNSDDTLYITKGNYKVSTKNNDVIVKVGTGKIILKDAVGEQISIKDSKGKVTTKTYGSSSSDLLAENNFVTADNLSEIIENSLSPADDLFGNQHFDTLIQKNLMFVQNYSESFFDGKK